MGEKGSKKDKNKAEKQKKEKLEKKKEQQQNKLPAKKAAQRGDLHGSYDHVSLLTGIKPGTCANSFSLNSSVRSSL